MWWAIETLTTVHVVIAEKSVVQNFVVTEAKDVHDEVTMPQVRPHCGAAIAASAAHIALAANPCAPDALALASTSIEAECEQHERGVRAIRLRQA